MGSCKSDMEIAFELQMEEALTDSLLVQPQLAINQNRSTPPIPIDPHTVQLLSQYEREQQDFQNTQRELLKIRNDLKCRVHDQTFARELLRIPEREWRNYGDNIEKPFNNKGASSSSSSSSGDDRTGGVEVFRLYFKGLFRNSGRNGAEIAGIGAAICDPEGNVILNVQKGLIGDWKSDWDVENLQLKVELKALIEGLNAALSLDIKRIDCFCDYHPLYQYITQRWLVHQQRIGTVVDQVCLLQRKFDRSRTFHVARKDVKFAFQLARGAIDSQITRSAESSHARKLKETCNICLEEIDVDQMFAVDGCLHRYCLSCMKQHVEVKLLNGVLPKCPHENCNTQLNIPSCRRFLTPDLIDKMNQHMMEASIPVTDKIYCPYPKCSVLMSKAEVMRYTDKVFVGVDRFATGKCIKCQCLFCMNCKVPWHFNLNCREYKRSNPNSNMEDVKLKFLATKQSWRQCIKCNHMIELAEGCYHMTCRCGYEFCYTCGAEWRNKKATCSCPIWDEANIVNDRRRRRLG